MSACWRLFFIGICVENKLNNAHNYSKNVQCVFWFLSFRFSQRKTILWDCAFSDKHSKWLFFLSVKTFIILFLLLSWRQVIPGYKLRLKSPRFIDTLEATQPLRKKQTGRIIPSYSTDICIYVCLHIHTYIWKNTPVTSHGYWWLTPRKWIVAK